MEAADDAAAGALEFDVLEETRRLTSFSALKPGSATRPMFGVKPMLLDNDGSVIDGAGDGCLVIADSWPGQMRTVWGDHERFFQTYFTTFAGYYFTGDGCRRDADGY